MVFFISMCSLECFLFALFLHNISESYWKKHSLRIVVIGLFMWIIVPLFLSLSLVSWLSYLYRKLHTKVTHGLQRI